MAGLFGGARQALQRANQPGGVTDRLALFGAQLQDIGGGGYGGRGGGGASDVMAQIAARQQAAQAQQALQQRTMQEDRLRAALSPADNAMGSGMGQAPDIQQQMAALDEARLMNPEVADKFAPLVQGREREQNAAQLFPDNPRAQMLYRAGNQEFLNSLGEQFKPQVIAADAIQSVAGENRQISNVRPREFGDSIVLATPQGVETLATRGPTYGEQTQRLGAGQSTVGRFRLGPDGKPIFEAPSEYTIGADQRRFEGGAQVAGPQADPNAGIRSEQSLAAIANTRRAVNDAKKQVGVLSTGTIASLVPFNQWKSNLEATADTIEANLSFNALQQMRDASKTGGALGGIAIRELELLGSTIASLKTSQSPEQFERSLDTIDASLDRWEKALSQPQQSGSTAPQLPPGFVLD